MDLRPDPDALLRQAARAERGRLKVFLGAAPGVGKTYEMLSAGQIRRREGVDVVVGIVETHGRAETQALLAGLEILPRRKIEYKGRELDEMDLDGLLARAPRLALVDELAHTNAPGSRHPKRWMDVRELLEAGIDVYTTVNIQHVESLNDVVASITHVRVRETVPDDVIDRADAIEVIDITPDDLLQRLREGKVYMPETASRAIGNYFSPGNLTALRELALRRTAQRVDAQLREHMRANAIAGPWAAGERVLVCVTPRGAGADLVRYGRRLAERLQAPWTALYIDAAREPDAAAGRRIAEQMRLAQSLGAEAVTIPGRDIAAEAIAYARAHNFTQIVVGNPGRVSWLTWLRGSAIRSLVAEAGDIPIHIAGGRADIAADKAPTAREPFRVGPYLGSTGLAAGATAVGLGLTHILSATSVSLVYLTAVLLSAAAFGLWPGLYACVVCVLAFNFFFLPPLYTFVIADPENVVALFFFLIAALIASNLAAGMRTQTLAARSRAQVTEQLYQFSRKLAGTALLDDLLWATAYQVAAMLNVHVVFLLPDRDGHGVSVRAGYPPEDLLDESDIAAAKWAWEHDRAAGRDSDNLPGARRLFIPLRTGRGAVAVIGLDADRQGPLLTPDQRRLLDALGDQAAIAIERITLAEDLDRSRLQAETERLRGALLTSISHDLRTPLASILGAATSLDSYATLLDEAARRELLGTIREEAERLNRFVGNLLDMTRLESGAVSAKREPTDVGEVAGSAMARAAKVLERHRAVLDVSPDLPLLAADPVLLEQVLFNLLDNAAKYAPPGTEVLLRAWRDPEHLLLDVRDEGPGLPPEDLDRVFEKFTRLNAADRQRPGTGLGLAICRGFVEAMGGRITGGNRGDRGGAVFTIAFPLRS